VYIIEHIAKLQSFNGKVGLSIGNFEGFHRGHTKIIQSLVHESKKRGLLSAVLTFKKHPMKVLNGIEPERLWAPADKLESFMKAGIELLIYIDFSPAFSSLTPIDFIRRLNTQLAPRLFCLGANFRFGLNNEGDVTYLSRVSHSFGFTVISIAEQLHEGVPVSSTRIRRAVKEGRMKLASDMLGRNYAVDLQFNFDEKTLSPFVPNSALPERGIYRGEVIDLVTKKTRRASVKIHGPAIRFLPRFSDHRVHLQRFIFSPEDGKKK
jgi:FAD synthase